MVEKEVPFDRETYMASQQIFEATATDVITGKSHFFRKTKTNDNFEGTKASATMPLFSKIKWINKWPYLDGSLSNSIPYQRAFDLGYQKVVVVATRDALYHKPDNKPETNLLAQTHYREYPNFVKQFENRPAFYNWQMLELRKLEGAHKVFVIRPDYEVNVKYKEDNTDKLKDLYHDGFDATARQMNDLKNYLRA